MKHFEARIRRDISVCSILEDEMVLEQDRQHLGKDFIQNAWQAMLDVADRYPGEVIYAVIVVDGETIAVANAIPYIDVHGNVRRGFGMLSYTGNWMSSQSHWDFKEVH